jgi:hypothetical protein
VGPLLRDHRRLLRQSQSADAPASTAEFMISGFEC